MKKTVPTLPRDDAFRDHVAVQVACICMTDLSRQISTSGVQKEHVAVALKFIAALSYELADEMLEARSRK